MIFNRSQKNKVNLGNADRRSRACWFNLALVKAFAMSALFAPSLPFSANAAKAAEELEYEADGEVTRSQYSNDSLTPRVDNYRFTVYVNNSLWLVQMIASSNSVTTAYHSSVAMGTDGTNTYSLLVFNHNYDRSGPLTDAINSLERSISGAVSASERANMLIVKDRLLHDLERSQHPTKSVSQNQAIGYVWPSVNPPNSRSDCSALLWFAYCSHEYLNSPTKVMHLPRLWRPLEDVQYTNINYIPANLTCTDQEPHRPLKAIYQHDGTRSDIVGAVIKHIPLESPFDGGYTNAIYEVTQMTNALGLHLPQSLVLTSYVPKKGSLVMDTRIEVTTTAIRTSCDRTSFVPSIPVVALIEDHRIIKNKKTTSSQYLVKTGTWPQITNSGILMQYQQEVIKSIKAQKRRKSLILTTLLVGVSISGFYLFRPKPASSQSK
jgi:hypothetical protein